ncbi:hypothetical protein [Neptuniibacter sp.]|uniref:hypothetical protein n=1 Tax=Neptuniibacter sp. TaxID=1962643 RepID=UPI00261D478D|nr:hypothetical protein [Neptuniibacter sp.]MCP4596468.1 hypothetical protein [Neptuniibacter sp.]
MGSDFEVNDRLRVTKESFLTHEALHQGEAASVYSLEQEFARSKLNRSYKLTKIISSLIVFMLLTSVAFHLYMRQQENNVEINIAEFDEVKLKELVFSIGNSNVELDMLRSELSEIENEHADLKSVVVAEYARREKLAQLQSDDVQIQQLNTELKQALEVLEGQYLKRKGSKQAQIDKLQAEIDQVEGEVQRFSGGSSAILNPEQKLQELRIKNVQRYYEKRIVDLKAEFEKEKQFLIDRYNPQFDDQKINQILNTRLKEVDSQAFSEQQQKYLSDMGLISSGALSQLIATQENQAMLLSRIAEIPYINSPQSASAHLQVMTDSLNSSYSELSGTLLDNLRTSEQQLDSYQYFLGKLLVQQEEAGYVLDPRDAENVVVHFARPYRTDIGDMALVFRQDDQLIAELVFVDSEQGLRAKVSKLNTGQVIQAMDKVILLKKRNAQ